MQSLILLLVSVMVAVGLIITIVKWIVGARKTDMSGFEIVPPGGGMRRGIIRIAEWLAILFVFLCTLFGAIAGSAYSYVLYGLVVGAGNGDLFRTDPHALIVLSAAWWGVVGFSTGALVTAPLFALAQIEMNTRRTAAMLERLSRPR